MSGRILAVVLAVACTACVFGGGEEEGTDADPSESAAPLSETATSLPEADATARDYADEPALADGAAERLEAASADDQLSALVLREEDASLVDGLDDLQVDATTWQRTGRVATVLASTGGQYYTVWLVEVEGDWLVSHTGDRQEEP